MKSYWLVFFAVLALALGTLPAEAGWQYAQWGMSPEQVIAASKGEANPVTAEDLAAQEQRIRKTIADVAAKNGAGPRNPDDWTRVLARGHRQIDHIDFEITFNFRYRKLEGVFLDPKDCNDYVKGKIIALLNSTYGTPIKNEQRALVQVAWSQPSTKTLIELSSVQGGHFCSIHYQPLPSGL